MGIDLYVGGHASRVQGEPQDLGGKRMFTAAHKPERVVHREPVVGMVDSGAFTDPPHKRLTPEAALDRQLAWETIASNKWDIPFCAAGLVSYDRLIDEKQKPVAIVAKCPVDLAANDWYRRRGFRLDRTETTPSGRQLNVWRLDLGND